MTVDTDFQTFILQVKTKTDIDLSLYKEAQMKRRLTALREKHGFRTFADYWHAMERERSLMIEFLDRMTINVSEFWRNPGRWETLQNRFLPELTKPGGGLKVWSAACSTGEEPYTIAMLLAEQGLLERSKLLATDLDTGVLAKAREGIYLERSLRDVPREIISTYFKQRDGAYEVTDRLKTAVQFRQHNLLHDSYESDFDLIVCRNVLIYFTEEAKQQLYHKFSEALRPGGLLFVGSTEQIFSPGQYGLETADTFFYRKL